MFGVGRFDLAITKDGNDLLFKASNRLGTHFELRVSPDSLNTLLNEVAPKPVVHLDFGDGEEAGLNYAGAVQAMVEQRGPSTVLKETG